MKKICKLCILLIFFGIIPTVVLAASCPDDDGDAYSGPLLSNYRPTSGYGTGKMFYIDSFNLSNNVLNMAGYAYLKGWTNIVNDGGPANKYCYIVDGHKVTGNYVKNVDYEFRLYSPSKNKSIPIPAANIKYDHWSGDLFRTTAPYDLSTGETYWNYDSSHSGNSNYLPRNNYMVPHYRGGFRIVNFNIKDAAQSVSAPEASDYSLQIKIKVSGPYVNNSKGYADWTDTLCDGHACPEWIDFHGYVHSTWPIGNTSDDVRISDRTETSYAKVIAERAHPKYGNDMRHCANSVLVSGQTVHIYDVTDNFKINGIGYRGYRIGTQNYNVASKCASGGYIEAGSYDKNVYSAATWLETQGAIKFKVKGTPPPENPPPSSKNDVCGDEYPKVVATQRVFLMHALYKGDQNATPESGQKHLIGICDGTAPTFDNWSGEMGTIFGLHNYQELANNPNFQLKSEPTVTKITAINSINGGEYGYDNLSSYMYNFDKTYKDGVKFDANLDYSIFQVVEEGDDSGIGAVANSIHGRYDNGLIPERDYLNEYQSYGMDSSRLKNSLLSFNVQGVEITASYSGGNKSTMKLHVIRTYDRNSIMAVNRNVKICNSDNTLNESVLNSTLTDETNGYNYLIQPLIVEISYCAKTTTCTPENYNPTPAVCSKDSDSVGKFYETEEAYKSVCPESGETIKNLDDITQISNDIGFTLEDHNPYCGIICLDDVDFKLPGNKGAYSGTYIDLNTNQTHELPSIFMKRSCYTKLDTEQFKQDYLDHKYVPPPPPEEGEDPIDEEQYFQDWKARFIENYVNDMQACLTFDPSLYTGTSKHPDIEFKYEDPQFGHHALFSDTLDPLVPDPSSDAHTILSTRTDESISAENNQNPSGWGYYNYNDILTNEMDCDIQRTNMTCTYQGRSIYDYHYLKKTEAKSWQYSLPRYFISIPDGSVLSTSNDRTIELDQNTAPISLKGLAGEYHYNMTLEKLDDRKRSSKAQKKLKEKFVDYGMYNNDSSTETYTCKYNVVDDIVKNPCTGDGTCNIDYNRKKANYFYRTIDVADPLPLSHAPYEREYGYNWTTEDFAAKITRYITDTEDYRKLVGLMDKNVDAGDPQTSDHFSFKLTPETMRRIRQYNSTTSFDNNNHYYIVDSDRTEGNIRYYYRSQVLDCLGQAYNGACNGLNSLAGLTDTTRDPNLIGNSRAILREKINSYIVE